MPFYDLKAISDKRKKIQKSKLVKNSNYFSFGFTGHILKRNSLTHAGYLNDKSQEQWFVEDVLKKTKDLSFLKQQVFKILCLMRESINFLSIFMQNKHFWIFLNIYFQNINNTVFPRKKTQGH